MRSAIIDFLDLYRLSTSRRLTALHKVRRLTEDLEPGHILRTRLDDAIALDEDLFDIEQRWKQRKRHKIRHGQRAHELDRQLDQLLAGLESGLAAQVRLRSVDPERGRAAEEMWKAIFPIGLGAITQASYADQAHATRRILKVIDESPGFQILASELRLRASIDVIRALNDDYFEEIASARPPRLEELQGLRRQGELRLGAIIARIFGLFPEETDDDRNARERLLAPIEWQNEDLRRLYKDSARNREGIYQDDGEAKPERRPEAA